MAQSNVFELGQEEYEERQALMASEEYNVDAEAALARNAKAAFLEGQRLNERMFEYFYVS